MKSLKQPNNKTCGQTTVAMITGKPVEEIIEIYGHAKTSNMYEAKTTMLALGHEVSDIVCVDNRKKHKFPVGHKAFIRIKYGRRNIGHFMALDDDGKVYDPNGLVYESIEAMLNRYNNKYKDWGLRVLVSHYYVVD